MINIWELVRRTQFDSKDSVLENLRKNMIRLARLVMLHMEPNILPPPKSLLRHYYLDLWFNSIFDSIQYISLLLCVYMSYLHLNFGDGGLWCVVISLLTDYLVTLINYITDTHIFLRWFSCFPNTIYELKIWLGDIFRNYI